MHPKFPYSPEQCGKRTSLLDTVSDAHWFVTEFGAVNLYEKSLQERARLMISIAHPLDRELLEKAAFERFGPHSLHIA